MVNEQSPHRQAERERRARQRTAGTELFEQMLDRTLPECLTASGIDEISSIASRYRIGALAVEAKASPVDNHRTFFMSLLKRDLGYRLGAPNRKSRIRK
jgi:hypothetical protein